MELTEFTKLYGVNKMQLSVVLINILKSTTKNVKKGGKKSAQNFFILKYIIKSFKTSNFYYQKLLA